MLIRTAADARRLMEKRRTLVQAPQAFHGSLDAFIERYVLPNLPSADAVAAFHDALAEYVALRDPLLLVRAVTGTTRREIYQTRDGTRIRATDNAPAWWVHATLVHGGRIAPGCMADVVATMPTHMFDVAAAAPPTASSAGWHIAHVLSVKDGDTDYRSWSRADAVRRFVRSVHPCNYFPIAKTEWQRWGSDARVIGRFAALFADRYHTVWPAFRALAGARNDETARITGAVPYAYDAGDDLEVPRRSRQRAPADGPPHTTPGRGIEQSAGAGRSIAAEYFSARLTFRRDVIERLAPDAALRIVTPLGTFEMTRAEFEDAFANVAASKSYRDGGVYHYPTLPEKALRFRREGK